MIATVKKKCQLRANERQSGVKLLSDELLAKQALRVIASKRQVLTGHFVRGILYSPNNLSSSRFAIAHIEPAVTARLLLCRLRDPCSKLQVIYVSSTDLGRGSQAHHSPSNCSNR